MKTKSCTDTTIYCNIGHYWNIRELVIKPLNGKTSAILMKQNFKKCRPKIKSIFIAKLNDELKTGLAIAAWLLKMQFF